MCTFVRDFNNYINLFNSQQILILWIAETIGRERLEQEHLHVRENMEIMSVTETVMGTITLGGRIMVVTI